jgi:prolipoprotein diacylglyceryltransferase
MEGEYRTLEWYRANKVTARSGFLWFGWLMFLGLSLGVASFLRTDALVMVGRVRYESVMALMALVIGAVGMYIRSGRKLSDDLAWKKKLRKRRRRI